MKGKQGYSALELLIVLCILAIVTVLSVQGYQLILKYQLETTTIAFYDALQLAKSLAIKQQTVINLGPLQNGRYHIWDPNTHETLFVNLIPKGIEVHSNIDPIIAFQAQGLPVQFGTVILSLQDYQQKIIINQSGRIRRES